MMGACLSSRTAATLAATALLVCASLTPAEAASTAQASSAGVAASSGAWGAVATTNTAAPYGTGALVLSFPNAGTNGQPSYPPQFFTVGNTGTINLTAATYTATGTPATASFTIESCSGAWNETANTCPGTITTVITTAMSPQTSTAVPAGAGQSIRLRAKVTGTIAKFTVPSLTLGVSVTRAQARAATTTGN
jgi:hypothetical protein